MLQTYRRTRLLLVCLAAELTLCLVLHRIILSGILGFVEFEVTDNDLRTPECLVPDFDDWQVPSMPRHNNRSKMPECRKLQRPPLVVSSFRELRVVEAAFPHYGVVNATAQLDCCYVGFQNPPPGSGGEYWMNNKCYRFHATTVVRDEFALVTCYISDASGRLVQLYEDVHAFFRRKRLRTPVRDTSLPSVFVLEIEALSREDVRWHMPMTRALLRRMSAVEMKGFSKVGNKTLDSLVPLLTGLSVQELKRRPTPFLWTNLSTVTAFADDTGSLLSGFRRQPPDFDPSPYFRVSGLKSDIGCNSLHKLLQYASKFLSFVNSKFLALFWLSSRELASETRALDAALFRFLHDRQERLRDTLLVLMTGRHPPSLHVVLPRGFRRTHRDAYHSLRFNARRLCTPFDLYRTLAGLDSAKSPRAVSLFARIPRARNCSNAGIEPQRCLGLHFTPVPPSETVRAVASKVVQAVNRAVAGHGQCLPVRLRDTVTAASAVLRGTTFHHVTVRTFPGFGVFEAIVGNLTVQHLLRLNHNRRGQCLEHSDVQQFCYCKRVSVFPK